MKYNSGSCCLLEQIIMSAEWAAEGKFVILNFISIDAVTTAQ